MRQTAFTAVGGVAGGISEVATTADTTAIPFEYIVISAAIGAVVGFIVNKLLDCVWASTKCKLKHEKK